MVADMKLVWVSYCKRNCTLSYQTNPLIQRQRNASDLILQIKSNKVEFHIQKAFEFLKASKINSEMKIFRKFLNLWLTLNGPFILYRLIQRFNDREIFFIKTPIFGQVSSFQAFSVPASHPGVAKPLSRDLTTKNLLKPRCSFSDSSRRRPGGPLTLEIIESRLT